jgi:hypothetical protein
MNIFSDKMIARRMLQAKQTGYTFAHFVRIGAKRYLLIAAVDVFLICLAYFVLRNYIAFFLLIGLSVGSFARDFAWFRTCQKSWPFTEKTTDWQKVEKIANDEPSA